MNYEIPGTERYEDRKVPAVSEKLAAFLDRPAEAHTIRERVVEVQVLDRDDLSLGRHTVRRIVERL